METATLAYRALRGKSMTKVPRPRMGAIAARFEDCIQLFERLCAYVAQLPNSSLPNMVENTREDLLAWGRDSGAVARCIDRTLRKSTKLSQRTLELLEKIHSGIKQAIDTVEGLRLGNEDIQQEGSILSQDASSLKQDEDAIAALIFIKNINKLVACLAALLPNLQNPFPIDLYSPDGSVSDSYPDIDTARALFPSASLALIRRLGCANWRRRKHLKYLRDQLRPEILHTSPQKSERRRPIREVAIDAFNFQKPILKEKINLPESSRSSVSTQFTRNGARQSSVGGSIYSKFGLKLDGSVIALSDSDSLDGTFHFKELTVPQPPITLGSSQVFLCPYCHDMIGREPNVISDIHDWENHVMSDLEPYLCTFDYCSQAIMTFADSERWFRHEIEHHRGELVFEKTFWRCQYCREDFEPAPAFESHLRHKHGNVCGPLQIETMVSLCVKSFNRPMDHLCPLCSREVIAETLKDHIANHLEQFALICIGDDSSEFSGSEDAEISSVAWDSISGDNPTKLQMLNDFVDEQLGAIPDGDQIAMEAIATGFGNNSTLFTLAHPRYDNFVGRDGSLADLYKILSVPGRICMLSGTGGVGKTAIAVEYTYLHEHIYSYIFWIQAETRFRCSDTFSIIAVALGLGSDGDDQTQLIETGRDFLERTEKKWLLIFDNVDDWESISKYIPMDLSKTQGSVLITSRISDLGPKSTLENLSRILLTEMQMEEGRLLLIRSLKPNLKYPWAFHPEWKVAGEIASLGGLPLAISHIAGFIDGSGCSLAEFLELWNERRKSSLSKEGETSNNNTLETIWNICLIELGSETLRLLKIMAFFDGDSIQREVLINNHNSPALGFLHSSQVIRCRRMITDLDNRKLISIKNQEERVTFSINRLLQLRLLQDLDENEREREEIFSFAFELIRERLVCPPIDTPDSLKCNVFKEYIPHVLAILRIFDEQLLVTKPFAGLAELFKDVGVHLRQRGIIYDSLRLLNSAEAIMDRLGPEKH